MTKKIITPLLAVVALIAVLLLPYFVFAANGPLNQLEQIQPATGYAPPSNENNAPAILGTIVAAALGLLGIIFIILIIYAGYTWMMAGGDEAKVSKAGDTIRRAIIGLLIVAGAYAISQFVIYKVLFGYV